MTADSKTNGFPDGYFIIRSAATKRLLDVACDDIEDGTELLLFPEKEKSLVERTQRLTTRHASVANVEVFYIDTSGALCSRSSGHALDIEGDRLVLRHRRPISLPFPNSYSHPLPKFSYDLQTKEIHVNFSCDPAYPLPSAFHSNAWKEKTYLLAAIPLRKPRTIIDDASQFIHSALTSSLSLFQSTSPTHSTPEEVYKSGVDLGEDEVVEEERGEEGEVDDSPEPSRKVRMLSVVDATVEDESLVEKARNRRRWQIEPLRIANKRTTA
ncbi:hypothetical protein EV421DRAFT_1895420 [Armillaria borealis]|uniref:Uncharacterized protein n=1 Tax=Armillaria borealis TaxID=47425 RepID=A0AA39KA10_9AGAR|nr:hypothetical protein EV421DRAFT_1895420 [Armillaria borealis]